MHDTGTKTFQTSFTPAGERGRPGGSAPARRPAPVFVRFPHLTRTAPGSLRKFTPSSDVYAERPGELPEAAPPRTHYGGGDYLPRPKSRISPVEHALRRIRREVQPATGHSVRNLIILVAILIAATGFTIWMTQGLQMDVPPPTHGPASAFRSAGEDAASRNAWDAPQPDVESTDELDEYWSWGPRTAQHSGSDRAPHIDSWPPAPSESLIVPGLERPPVGPEAVSAHLPGDRRLAAPPRSNSSTQGESTPVANLITIEPAGLRR